jgi:hypothetical protein
LGDDLRGGAVATSIEQLNATADAEPKHSRRMHRLFGT